MPGIGGGVGSVVLGPVGVVAGGVIGAVPGSAVQTSLGGGITVGAGTITLAIVAAVDRSTQRLALASRHLTERSALDFS